MPNEENLKPFKKGYDSRRNYKGRPKNLTRQIKDLFKDEVETPSDTDIHCAIAIILNINEQEIEILKNNKNTPYWIKIIINELTDNKKGFKALEVILKQAFGTNIQGYGY